MNRWKMEEATAEDAGPGGRDGAVDVGTDAREDHRGTSAASAAASPVSPLQLAQDDEGPRTVTPSEHQRMLASRHAGHGAGP